jgi:hypothetical protein
MCPYRVKLSPPLLPLPDWENRKILAILVNVAANVDAVFLVVFAVEVGTDTCVVVNRIIVVSKFHSSRDE